VSEWHWIALAVYVVGFFLTPYAVGRLTRDQSSDGMEDGCGMLATMIVWPVAAAFLFVAWVLVGLPMWLLKKGQGQ
jgi:hypothetical protein